MAHPDVEEQAPAEPAVAPDHSDGTDSEAQELRDATNPDKQPAPFDAPFAPLSPPFVFWLDSVLIVLLGGFLGALGYGYLQAITEATTDGWISADGNAGYPSDPASLRFGAGRAWWVGLCAGAGLVIGLTRTALDLETAPSFITELRELHVDPWLGLRSATVTLMSLVAGAPMGPEAGLGALSGLLGTLVGRWRPLKVQPDVRRRLYVLSAMCSAFATVLPNPFIALMLCMELGRPLDGGRMGTTTYPELASLLTLGATVSYVVYFAISGSNYFQPIIALGSLEAKVGYDSLYITYGLAFGVMGALYGLVYVLIAGVLKRLVGVVRARLDAAIGRWPRVVVLATLGGAGYGALGWAMPLVLTDGAGSLGTVALQGAEIGTGVLAASAFTKTLAYHLAFECGFSGGLFLPMISMSTMLGRVFVNVTGANALVSCACASIALAAALVPAPAMLGLLANALLLVGPTSMTPIFFTAITAHVLCMGVGLPQNLLARVQQRKERKAERAVAAAAAAATAKARPVE